MSDRVSLADLRRKKGFTQSRVGDRLQINQPAVARLEKRSAAGEEIRLSTLHRYVRALGGTLELRVELDGQDYRLGLP